MSGTVSRGREAGRQAEALADSEARGSLGRVRWVALGIVVVVAAGAVAGWRAGVFSPAATSGAAGARGPPWRDPGRHLRGGEAAGPVGDDAGGRDAGVCRVLPGDRAGQRDADLAAVGWAGDPAGSSAVQDR